MEYVDLTPDEQMLLVGLLEMVSAADRKLSDQEAAFLRKVATEMGMDQFQAIANAAHSRLETPEDFKRCALAVQRPAARALILTAIQDIAVSDEVTIEEMKIVNWLADLWDL